MNKKDINEKGILKRLDEFKDYTPLSSSEGKISDSRGISAIPKNEGRNDDFEGRMAIDCHSQTEGRVEWIDGNRIHKSRRIYRQCVKCGYVFQVRKRRAKRRQCELCRGKVKVISQKAYLMAISSTTQSSLQVRYEILWKSVNKKRMEELYDLAKKHNISKSDFEECLVDLYNQSKKKASMVASYFYDLMELRREVIRK